MNIVTLYKEYSASAGAEKPQDVSVRLQSFYEIQTDQVVTRFDILLGYKAGSETAREAGDQFGVMIYSTRHGVADLELYPGQIAGISFVTNRQELAHALRLLANKLDSKDTPPDA